MVLPGTNIETAKIITERVRKAVAEMPISYKNQKINITISLGVTTVRTDDDRNSLFSRVGNLMYGAKQNGRNFISRGANQG